VILLGGMCVETFPNRMWVTEEEKMPKAVKRGDVEKERYWQKVIGEAARSGKSIRAFCREQKLKESQFYWWQRKLRERREERRRRRRGGQEAPGQREATFALVSEEPGQLDAGIELVLSDGRRVRISKGVDAETLRTVLAAVEGEGC
jgi:hypothetical protein